MERICKGSKIVLFYGLVVGLFLLGTLLGNRAVTVISENAPVPRRHCIVIDAGHGGEDGGASSCTGKLESSINLDIALRLDDLFHLLGQDTVMIRKADTAVYTRGETIAQKKVSDLKNRVQLVNARPNALLLSIHQNHFTDQRYSGGQVFYAGTAGSEAWAKEIQTAFRQTVNPGSKRDVKQGSGIYLLEKITVPGVLVECGFLSNPEEEGKLCTPEYQKKLCCILAAVTAQFLQDT